MAEIRYSPDLSVRSLFSRGWEAFREHTGFMVGVFLIYCLLTGSGNLFALDNWFGGLGQLIMFVIAGPVTAGTYAVALSLVRGYEADIGEMFEGFQVFGRAFGVFAAYTILVVAGLIVLVVPGIYVMVALAPAMFLVLDDDLGVADTLRKAWSMTEDYRGQIFIVFLAVLGLNLLGLLLLVVGVIFTGAMSLLIGGALYDELARAHETEAPVEVTHPH